MPARLKHWACVAALAWAGVVPAQDQPTLILMSDSPMDAAELFERVSPSIWLVMTSDEGGKPLASGSAVVIAPETLVTNCHVLTRSVGVTVRNEGRQFTARRDLGDETRDLCLLNVPGLRAPAVTLAHESSLRPGMRVYAIGSPRRLEQTISDGLLSALRRGAAGDLQMVQTSAPISPGSSGGGLFDAHGRLIGITTSGLKDSQNLNFAVPARLVAELAQRSGVPGRAVVVAPPYAPPVAAPPVVAVAPREIVVRVPGPQRIEYRLTDRLTGNARPVVFARDAESAQPGTVSYNGGSWIERPDGEIVQAQHGTAGEFDGVMPPGGWAAGLRGGKTSWPARYSFKTSDRTTQMDLEARVVSEGTETLGTRSLRTVVLEFRGYTQRFHGNVALTQNQFGAYRAQVVYAPEIQRVIRFEARTRGGTSGGAFIVDEALELTDLR